MALAIAPNDGGPVTILPITINAGVGTDEYDPHVNGDLAAYTASDKIRYYDFFSGNDAQVPSALGATDLLSDVSNGRIVFSRIETSGQIPVMVYDIAANTTTKVYPRPTEAQFSAAIGGDTVAFIDAAASASGELVISTLGGSSSVVTGDTRTEQSPSVSPLGDLVVYESCGTNCDIRQAGWNGSSWVVTNLTNTADQEHNPDTDGVVVVYDAVRGGEKDIAWQHVGGDAEQLLNLPGEQRNPSVSGGVIAFESVAVGDTAADLFVYQLSTNRLYRITSTPADESLNDVYVLPDGSVRLVWSSGPEGSRDVFGATIELPGSGGTGGGGGTCTPSSVSVSASINYHKHSWSDGAVDVANLSFQIPSSIPTTEGNAANGTLWASFWKDGGEVTKCLYKGDGKTGDGATSSSFVFHHCTVSSVTAGTLVTADHVRVHIANADENLSKTSVGATFGTTCPTGGSGTGVTVTPPAVGCSSSGGTFTVFALALALLAWMTPRRQPVAIRARRSNR
jgi:uncharacterized protein (TIGR03382 family)